MNHLNVRPSLLLSGWTGIVALLFAAGGSASAQFANGYSYSGQITIPYANVPNSDQLNYPVLISGTYSDLATPANGGKVVSPSGYDIIFTSDAAGQNRLNFERQSYSVTGTVAFFVQVPVLSHTVNTTIYIFYGNSSVHADQSNPAATWNSNYLGVWHLESNPAGTAPQEADSTSGAHNLTSAGPWAPSQLVPAVIGDGVISTETSNGFVAANPATLSPSTTFTLQAWINMDFAGIPDIISQVDFTGLGAGYVLYLNGLDNFVRFKLTAGNNGGLPQRTFEATSGNINDGRWHHIAAVYSSGSSPGIYVDGQPMPIVAYVNGVPTPSATTIYSGSVANDGEFQLVSINALTPYPFLNGTIDEVRISNVALSSDWIATDYANQNSPSTFYSATWGITSSGVPPGLGATPLNLTYSGTTLTNPPAQSVAISNTGSGTLNWTATANESWIQLATTANGTGSGTLTGSGNETIWILPVSTALSPGGPVMGTVTISAPGASPSTQTVSVLLTVTSGSAGGVWPNGYSYSGRITVSHLQVPNTDQLNFPVLVSGSYSALATVNNGGQVTSSTGYDIIFTSDENGLNPLNFERESYASNGQVTFWVQVPDVSPVTDTVFYIFYGKSGAPDQSTPASTWDANYLAVWHMQGNPAGTAPQEPDSTGKGHSLTAAGPWTSGSLVSGIIGDAIESGYNDGFSTSNSSTLSPSTAMTISAWIKINYGGLPTILSQVNNSGLGAGYTLTMDGTTNHVRLTISAGSNGGSYQNSFETTSGNVNDGNWHSLTATYVSGSTPVIYVDGVPVGVAPSGSSPTVTGSILNSSPFYLIPYQSYYFLGSLDEARVSSIARSADWIATEYHNESNPGSFYSVIWGETSGAPPTPGLGVTPTMLIYSGSTVTNPAPQSFSISNSGGGGTLSWSASSNQSWLLLSTTSNGTGSSSLTGSGAQTLYAQVNSTTPPLSIGGPYAAIITIDAPGATPSMQSVSVSLSVTAGPPSTMTANSGTTPQSATINAGFTNALAVTVKDASSNPVSGVNVTFTAPGSGASGLFSNSTNTITVATNSSGVASVPLTANATAGGPYTVTAAASGLSTVNFSLTNTVGTPSTMTANTGTTPQSAAINVGFTNALAVTVKDAGSNPVSGVNVTFAAPSSGASGLFSNSSTTIVVSTNGSGIASASFTANGTSGGPYTVTAAATGLTTVNFSLTNTSGTPSTMTANTGTTPQSARINVGFTNALAVTVKDAGSNPVSGVNVTFTAPSSGASGLFGNSTNTITVGTNGSGVASAPFTANATAGGAYTVTATATGLATVNFSLTNTVGTPSTMTANTGTTPQSAGINAGFTNALAVTVKDAGSNPVSGVNVTFTAPGSGASGLFSNSSTTITLSTNGSGVASASFTANATSGGPYTVTAAATGLTTVNFSLTNTGGGGGGSTYSNGYSYSGSFTVSHTLVPNTDQANFPVLISGTFPALATVKNGGQVQNLSGYDIIFTSDAAGLNRLNYERESYSPNGQVTFWVNTSLSHTVDTPIYVFYGNSSINMDQSNAAGAWNSNYLGVWHLDGNPAGAAPQEPDSTSGGHALTAVGSWLPSSQIAGQIGDAIQANYNSGFTGANAATLSPTTAMTLHAWIRTSSAGWPTIMTQFNTTSFGAGYDFSIEGTGQLRLTLSAANNGGTYQTTFDTVSGNVIDGNWHYVAATYSSGSTPAIYIDGVPETVTSSTSSLIFSGSLYADWSFNLAPFQSYYYQGSIDEARVSAAAESADWIATEYNNQSNPSSFYSAVFGLTP